MLMDKIEKKIAYCGLPCGTCPAYKATVADDLEQKERVAVEWSNEAYSLEPADIECNGCRSNGKVASFCMACPIRTCAREKGLEYCIDCKEYACANLELVFSRSLVAKKNLEKIHNESK